MSSTEPAFLIQTGDISQLTCKLDQQAELISLLHKSGDYFLPLSRLLATLEEDLGAGFTVFCVITERVSKNQQIIATKKLPHEIHALVSGYDFKVQGALWENSLQNNAPVFSPSIADDPFWEHLLSQVKTYDFNAGWSFPVNSFDRETAGWLIVLARTGTGPDAHQRQLIEIAVHNTQLLISYNVSRPDKKVHTSKLNEHFPHLLQEANFPVAVYKGEELRIIYANQAFAGLPGMSHNLINKCYTEVFSAEMCRKVSESISSVYEHGRPYVLKHQKLDSGTEVRFYNFTFAPLRDHEGKVQGILNTAAEVTELITAYNELELNASRAKLAIEASDQGTFDVDLLTNNLRVSDRLAQIFDVDKDADRMRYVTAIHPEDLENRTHAYARAYQDGILDYEGRILKKDESVCWIRVKGKMYFNEQRVPTRLLGIVQDISDQKTSTDALQKNVEMRTRELDNLNKKLVAINDELQQFAYVTSHDLREPLRKIKVFSRLVLEKLDQPQLVHSYLSKVMASAERMSGLIHNLLEYSLVSNTKPRFEKVNLNSVVSNILTDYELVIEQKKAQIIVDQLPEIEAIPLLMNQLFFNLIGNALKFTRKEVNPSITISSEIVTATNESGSPVKYTEINVEDNGLGFDPVYASRIFTVFQRLNEETHFGGYGIGLALCKKVVEVHRGIIEATGHVNEGASFKVRLPLTHHPTNP